MATLLNVLNNLADIVLHFASELRGGGKRPFEVVKVPLWRSSSCRPPAPPRSKRNRPLARRPPRSAPASSPPPSPFARDLPVEIGPPTAEGGAGLPANGGACSLHNQGK